MQLSITFDLSEPKAKLQKQLQNWNTLLNSKGGIKDTLQGDDTSTEADESEDTEEDEAPAKKVAKGKGKPAKTVSEDEEESFGEEELSEEELEASTEDDEDDEEESSLSWDEVKDTINKYGNKKPAEMKAILLSFNMKTSKELQQHKGKWEAVYRKVQSKLKALKKAK